MSVLTEQQKANVKALDKQVPDEVRKEFEEDPSAFLSARVRVMRDAMASFSRRSRASRFRIDTQKRSRIIVK